MANYGKRMVPEYLIKGLEEAYAKTSGGTGSTINLMENIVDSKGNKRFIEGEGSPLVLEGFNPTYNKWSLSGTHLMLVLAGNIANTTTLTNGTTLIEFTLPDYITKKIFPVFATYRISYINGGLIADDWSSQTLSYTVEKSTAGIKFIVQTASLTLTANRSFRFQFDLLIDADYSE